MNILVTGGTGFIGSNIVEALLAEGHNVCITGTKNEVNVENVKFYKTHLTGLNWTALAKENIDVVFHQAANNDTQDQDEADMIAANFDAPCYLFNMLYRFGCRQFVYASSTAVYGNSPSPYIEDQTPLDPLTPYAKTKAMFDEFAMAFAKERPRTNVIGLRYCNVYGCGEHHKDRRASMIFQIMDRVDLNISPTLFKYGEQSRDWIYIKDVVKANLLAMTHQGSGIYNCGTGVATSFNDILKITNALLQSNVAANYIDNPIADTYQNVTCCNIDKIKAELGFTVDFDIQSGIADYYKNGSCNFWEPPSEDGTEVVAEILRKAIGT
jgi:ADP-L-glycero-D-manno-heptose 6-epimerase